MKYQKVFVVLTCLIIAVAAMLFTGCEFLFPQPDSDTTPPGEVSNLQLTDGGVYLRISWTNPDDADFSHVLISYSAVGVPSTQLAGTSIDPEGSYIHPTTLGTVYTVLVKTVDESENVSEGVTQSRATGAIDTVPPNVELIDIVTTEPATVAIAWVEPDVPDFSNVLITYSTWVDGGPQTYDQAFVGAENPAGTTITGLIPGNTYAIRIVSVDDGGNTSSGTEFSKVALDYPVPDYSVGDTGPGGGLICYIDTTESYDWKYLEAAPVTWRGSHYTTDENSSWAATGSTATVVTTTDTIDSGEANTEAIVDAIGVNGIAAYRCWNSQFGGFKDWFLPSLVQLETMYDNLHQSALGDFEDDDYWSSVQNINVNDNQANYMDFSNGHMYGGVGSYVTYGTLKTNTLNIRPMRSFRYDEMVAEPAISGSGARTGGTDTVTITCGTPEAAIYYTTDGSDPVTSTTSTRYTAPFPVSTPVTVKAVGVRGGWDDSLIAEEHL